MGKPRVLLADDHPVVLAGLQTLLRYECDVVGTARDGRMLLDLAPSVRPDLIILDISMPRMGGLEAARRARAILPACKLIFLTMHSRSAYLEAAIESGADGYLLKRDAASELVEAVREVWTGRRYVSEGLRGKLVAHGSPTD